MNDHDETVAQAAEVILQLVQGLNNVQIGKAISVVLGRVLAATTQREQWAHYMDLVLRGSLLLAKKHSTDE